MKTLEWTFVADTSEWYAVSTYAPYGVPLTWRIGVCEDGTFDTSESDVDLLPSLRWNCMPNLAAAKDVCQQREKIIHEPATAPA